MKYLLLNGSIVGKKTRTMLDTFNVYLENQVLDNDLIELIDLRNQQINFSDGRHWQDNQGDTLEVLQKIMAADVIILGVPTYQASIPAPLKNIFDLLPEGAFYQKTVGFLVSAGTAKHFLVMEFQLKPILSFMKANTLSNYVFAQDSDFNGTKIDSDAIRMRLASYAEDVKVTSEAYRNQIKKQDNSYGF
ncbi:MAG: NAD(P)H-dependent oxidoreductase [Lactococcus sp.]|nr:NAD(P)H-dependent oxidoreductase [Lactococcus sp.]